MRYFPIIYETSEIKSGW